jgi:hypothetical protein
MTQEELKEMENKANELKALISDKVKEETKESKEQVVLLQKELTELKEALKAAQEEAKEHTELIAKLGEERKTVSNSKAIENSLSKELDKIFDTEKFKEFAAGKSRSTGVFETDALKQINFTDFTGDGHSYTGVAPGLYPQSQSPADAVRNFTPSIDAPDMAAYSYLEVTDINRNAAVSTENGELSESAFKLNEKIVEIKRIGTYLRISKRLLRCLSALRQYIISFVNDALIIAENFQLIFGDGNGNNVKGIVKYASTESEMTGYLYELDSSDFTVATFASYDNADTPTKTYFVFDTAIPNIQTGMKVVIANVVNATTYNQTFSVEKVNDNTIGIAFQATSTFATDFANATFKFMYDFAESKDFANKLDAIESIIAFQTFGQFRPNLCIINPLEHDKLRGIKDKVGRNLYSDYVTNGRINDVFILESTAIPTGKVLIGDWIRGCKIFDGLKANIEFAEDRESKRKNFIELIIQEELIFACEVPQAFIYADLDTLVTFIDSGKTLDVSIVSPLNEALDAVQMEEKTTE